MGNSGSSLNGNVVYGMCITKNDDGYYGYKVELIVGGGETSVGDKIQDGNNNIIILKSIKT